MAAIHLAYLKDTYTGVGAGPDISVYFHSPYSLSSNINTFGATGYNYISQYHINGNMYSGSSYVTTFSFTQGYKWSPAVNNSISTIGSPRDVSYDTGFMTGIGADVYGSIPGFPQIHMYMSNSWIWAYSIFVEEYLTIFNDTL